MITQDIDKLKTAYPLLHSLIALQECYWLNSKATSVKQGLSQVGVTLLDVQNAEARLLRFAPYLAEAFPETQKSQGIIESAVVAIPAMKTALQNYYGIPLAGDLWLKKDSHLPISGSIKARGGIYEVLAYAEHCLISQGLLATEDNYKIISTDKYQIFLNKYHIIVGSTGNLGLSIGIMAAKLGFQVTVHMAAAARQWKKEKLRTLGVNVIEYPGDYGVAVAKARKQATQQSHCFFIDDENSTTLFLGYAVAGLRLRQQFSQMGKIIDKQHPLCVYLPCGVGGGPGGVTFGLKLAFGEAVHCFFAEPTHSPCMLLGVYTGLHDHICVQDIGIDNITAADGLAVGRASGFVGRAMEQLINGFYTIADQQLYNLLALLDNTEKIQLEPSALAGMAGPFRLQQQTDYSKKFTEDQWKKTTHLIWATGGGMVPVDEMARYLAKGLATG